ncbi:hypothetical protein AUC68_00130 [Methyloceanibacter methanicus]|uniref:Uncharacterized protein n=1 Tax=Methyloceanibacter methanicus TaxID=1774968 RepID=A0A1E3W683_9HYPH|nr:hypothetical protein AUC68_00130 [Methyloceanibacter methanicus]
MLPLTVPEIRMLSRLGVTEPEARPWALNVRSSQLPESLPPLTLRLLRMCTWELGELQITASLRLEPPPV